MLTTDHTAGPHHENGGVPTQSPATDARMDATHTPTTASVDPDAGVKMLQAVADAEIQQMAAALNTNVRHVRRMLAAGRQAEEREQVENLCGPGSYEEPEKLPHLVPVEEVLRHVQHAQRIDPMMTVGWIARQIGMDKGDLRRALGVKARQNGSFSTTMRRETAAQILRVIGVAPCEVTAL